MGRRTISLKQTSLVGKGSESQGKAVNKGFVLRREKAKLLTKGIECEETWEWVRLVPKRRCPLEGGSIQSLKTKEFLQIEKKAIRNGMNRRIRKERRKIREMEGNRKGKNGIEYDLYRKKAL
ncbi:hypothetical protein Tco_0910435 [Tanacetum coccineum]|uniref:Uncharacterized protein n=1 Tax=Tanacetum coccineum TaxID=301880 RepID=A0ABQ5CU14_9ASTR